MAEPERTETSSGLSVPPKVLPSFSPALSSAPASHPLPRRADSPFPGKRDRRPWFYDEAGRHIETDLRHLAQIGSLATEQHLVFAVALLESKYPLPFHHYFSLLSYH